MMKKYEKNNLNSSSNEFIFYYFKCCHFLKADQADKFSVGGAHRPTLVLVKIPLFTLKKIYNT